MSNDEGGKIWVNIETGKPHGGDQLPGDREATVEEYEAFLGRDKNSKIKEATAWFKTEQDKRHTTLVSLIGSRNEVGQEKVKQSLTNLKAEFDNKIKEILQAAD